jgi:thermitase
MAEGYKTPDGESLRYVVQKPRTFQGYRVAKTVWEGQSVDAVEGLWLIGRTNATGGIEIELIRNNCPMDVSGASKTAKSAGAGVKWIEPVMLDFIVAYPNDPFFEQQWALEAIRAQEGWDHCKGDPETTLLAVLDTGMPLQGGVISHPDFDDSKRFIFGRNWIDGDDEPMDDNGHGTHVLGIAAAGTNNQTGVAGLLWQGTVFVSKTTDSHGQSSADTLRRGMRQAIATARERKARLVVNYSARGPKSHTKRAIIEEALEADALVVAAAGNNAGEEIDYPAAYSVEFPNVIAVGAVDKNLQGASFSSAGHQMTVAAPGVDILSTLPNYLVRANVEGFHLKYDLMSGTSMAAPLVSALACLVLAKFPTLSAEEVRDKIVETVQKLPTENPHYVGMGLIDAEQALR